MAASNVLMTLFLNTCSYFYIVKFENHFPNYFGRSSFSLLKIDNLLFLVMIIFVLVEPALSWRLVWIRVADPYSCGYFRRVGSVFGPSLHIQSHSKIELTIFIDQIILILKKISIVKQGTKKVKGEFYIVGYRYVYFKVEFGFSSMRSDPSNFNPDPQPWLCNYMQKD